MSGLSGKERAGCTAILKLMSAGDLLSLCDTVTNKMIAVENITEAMETILCFSTSAEELLRRKKVHREHIFKYLAQEGVAMAPSSEKHQLVKRTLELWSSGKVKGQEVADDRSHQGAVDPTAPFDPQVLGQHFCQWFFPLLNSQNPSLGQQPQDWGPQHFWPDVKLCLLARTVSEQKEEFLGADLVGERLQVMSKDERLIFSPNLQPSGLRTLVSPHGMVLVAVAGTIHRDTVFLGIFEQIFGLLRSPMENNTWKIKSVHLKIRGQDAMGGTEVVQPALTYNASELQLLGS